MAILAPLPADKTARKYHWLNFHPASETQAVREWFNTSISKFQTELPQVYPLVLQGETGVGRHYLLEAAYFGHERDGLPVTVLHWDLELWDAPTLQAQFEHMQARLDDIEHSLEIQNPSLWSRLKTLGEAVDAKLPLKLGKAEVSINLTKILTALFVPSPAAAQSEGEAAGSDVFQQTDERFRRLLRDSHVILHVRHAELLDGGLLQKLWDTVFWLNDTTESGAGFMGLAFSFTPAYPLAELLGAKERYATVFVAPMTVRRVSTALRETFGKHITDDAFVDWLLRHAALQDGILEGEHLGQLLDKLMDEGLLGQADGEWAFAPPDDLEPWRKAVGKSIAQHWRSRWEQVPTALRPRLEQLFKLAALGGEWIPVDLLLDYLGVHNSDARDDLVDILDDVFAGIEPTLLRSMDWHFVGMKDQGLIYRFQAPLLTTLIIDPATRQKQAGELLAWLQKRWPAPKRNQAAYMLRLADHTNRETAHALREQLAWQVESEFAAELHKYLLAKLVNHELSLASLSRIMSQHYAVWPMPRCRAICRAWLRFYQQGLRDVSDQQAYAGTGWDELWETTEEFPVPATDEGLHLCYFYGRVQTDEGLYSEAEQWFQSGLKLCRKHPNQTLEAHFHLGIAALEYYRGALARAEQRLRHEALPRYEKLGDVRSKAVTMGKIADILQARGQLDEALNIRENHELPVYEKLGDVRSKAVTMGQIADILQARGQLDEALNIRQTEQLPVYEKLGDVRSKAVTMGQIADILQARGQLDEALNIRQTEQLPVYEKLGDVRSKAVTMGQIADILQARGQLDEALNIRQTEQLPVYEKLGDVREKAVTMGQIADILQARGQLDEALNIRQTEQLPVYEKLGDVRSKAVTMGQIADILQVRGQLDEALNIRQTEQLPVYEKLGDVRSKAVTMGQIADILQSRNKLDNLWRFIRNEKPVPPLEALEQSLQTLSNIMATFQSLENAMQIGRTYSQTADLYQVSGQRDKALELREKEISIFATSDYAPELLVSRAKLAILLWQMDAAAHAGRIQELLGLALTEARRQRIPEAEQIENILEEMGLSQDNNR